jgi:hypothetical protein
MSLIMNLKQLQDVAYLTEMLSLSQAVELSYATQSQYVNVLVDTIHSIVPALVDGQAEKNYARKRPN